MPAIELIAGMARSYNWYLVKPMFDANCSKIRKRTNQ